MWGIAPHSVCSVLKDAVSEFPPACRPAEQGDGAVNAAERPLGGPRPTMDRNIAFELARVTEAAAMAAARWMGRGDKNGADQAAVTAMRTTLGNVDMDGIVVIGEGEKDEAPM